MAEPLKGVWAAGTVTEAEASGADGADGADGEMEPAEAVPTGAKVLFDTGYGATEVMLLRGTPGAVGTVPRVVDGAVLRMTAGMEEEEFAVTSGNDETTIGVEETASGLVADEQDVVRVLTISVV